MANDRREMSGHDPAARRGPNPPVFLLGAMAVMLALHSAVPAAVLIAPRWRWAGAAFIAAGAVLNVWADRLFKGAGTAVKPFEPTTALVVTGPFSISRNPMYLGMTLILVGIAVALGSATPWLAVPVFAWQITGRFVVPEERKLREAFGSLYAEYAARVRRWL
jgi:protein-S-isoprenylcysteine O-methyltransferase Ste14